MQENNRFHRLLDTTEQDEVYIIWKKAIMNLLKNLHVL